MNTGAAASAIRSLIETQWSVSGVGLIFENEILVPPGDGSPFLNVEIVWNGGLPVSIGSPGSNRSRRLGIVWCHAMVPTGSGRVLADTYAGQFASILEQQDFSGVVFSAAEPGGGQSGMVDGTYYGQSVAIPFYYDETA